MTRTVLAVAAFLLCAAGVVAGVASLPAPGAAAAPVVVAAAVAAPSSAPAHVDADAAFLADLFDGAATDVDPAQAAALIAIGHRMCDLGQPRADWLAALTAPGPHALTDGEAGKLFDVAHAVYCGSPA